MTPDLQRHVGKYYGKYSGEVTDNEDPDNQGRITVKVPPVFGEELEVRARPCLPFGHFFVPAVAARVWVEFEAGDPNYPIWVGTWYPAGAAPPEAAISPPDNRVIQTPSGHTIEILDKAGDEKIVVKHKSNAFVAIDKNGSVVVANKNGSHLSLNAQDENAVLMDQNQNVITLTSDGVVIANKDGATLEMKGDMVRVLATNVVLQGTTVALGSQAMEPTILGTQFSSNWNAFIFHTHPTAVGPTGTPLPPGLPLLPGNGLTSAVVVK